MLWQVHAGATSEVSGTFQPHIETEFTPIDGKFEHCGVCSFFNRIKGIRAYISTNTTISIFAKIWYSSNDHEISKKRSRGEATQEGIPKANLTKHRPTTHDQLYLRECNFFASSSFLQTMLNHLQLPYEQELSSCAERFESPRRSQ